jgi:hypothetical protein
MLGALLLFQAAAAMSLSDAPRQEVSAGPSDLSEVAGRVHLNRKALEGWVPKKGTAPPPVDWESIAPPVPTRRPARELAPPPEPEIPETVNGFDQPRPWFYGAPAFSPRHTINRHAPRPRGGTRTFAARPGGPVRARFR